MTEAQIVDAVRDAAAAGDRVDISGAGTLLAALPEPPACRRISLEDFRGVVAWEASDLNITVRAGTPVHELNAMLAEQGQECPIEGPGSTVGGRIASGLTGLRRLGAGALREWLLGARMITATGATVQLGGRTVKNVTGYDLPRLLCGSWGTLGILTDITLRVRPAPFFRAWYVTDATAGAALRTLYRPAAVVRTHSATHVLLEGHPEDCSEQAARASLTQAEAPQLPDGVRIAVPPANIEQITAQLTGDYAAEAGVGIVHADPPMETLPQLRRACAALGGRMLVLARGTAVSTFGEEAHPFDARVKLAFDPCGLFAPWRFAA